MLVVGLLRDAIEAALGILLFVLFHRAPEAVGIFVRAVAEDVIKEIKTHNWNLLIINEMQSSIDLVRTYSLNQHSDYNCPHEGNPKGVFRNFRKFKSLVFGKIILTVDKNKGKCTESASKGLKMMDEFIRKKYCIDTLEDIKRHWIALSQGDVSISCQDSKHAWFGDLSWGWEDIKKRIKKKVFQYFPINVRDCERRKEICTELSFLLPKTLMTQMFLPVLLNSYFTNYRHIQQVSEKKIGTAFVLLSKMERAAN
ncbi:hypothetical protein M5E87_16215 [Flavonifractor plautii]|nr:hypothetical protein M5E87_16215 [Flavonifractor plautii]